MYNNPNQISNYPMNNPGTLKTLPPKRSRRGLWIGLAVGLVVLIGLCAIVNAIPNASSSSHPVTSTVVKSNPTSAPTRAVQSTNYPPKTEQDLRGLAKMGDINAIHEFHSESVGLVGACPQPKREVTVSSSLKGKQLAEDLLAYFYEQQLDSPCGAVVFAYYSQNDTDNGYTAGRVLFDTTDATGQENVDPNAIGLKYTLTLDVGNVLTAQEYTVKY